MPDKRTHRGRHPDDTRLFHPDQWPALRLAAADLSWLLTRGYALKSAIKLVGDRHDLTVRQRIAVWRSACDDAALASRCSRMQSAAAVQGRVVAIDAYNVLLTVESALAGGFILVGRDGCYRDLASVHGTYRKVEETMPAIRWIGEALTAAGVPAAVWYVDRPVSNSGRLRGLLEAVAVDLGWDWQVHLVHNPDQSLVDSGVVVASSDSWVLDHCGGWLNLAREVVRARAPEAALVAL